MKARTKSESPPAPIALAIPEAAQAAGIGRSSIYSAAARGDLKFTKCGRRTVIRVEELQRWLRSLDVPVPVAPAR